MQERRSPTGTSTDQIVIFLDPGTLALVQTAGRVQDLLGYSDEQLRQKSLTDIIAEPPPEELRERLRPIENDVTELKIDVRLRNQNGGAMPAELLLVRLNDHKEQALTAVVRIGHAARLEPGDTEFGDFASRLGHDVNNLLSTVIGSLGLIREDLVDDSDSEGRQLVDDALSAGRECADLVDRLMTAAGKQLLRRQRVAVNDIVNRLTPLLSQTLPEAVELRVSLAEDIPDLDVDPDRLEAAILGLVVNAREAMPRGGELLISSDVGKALGARPALPSDRAYVRISVTDAGESIPEQLRDRVLEPLFSTKSGGTGRGMGLSMVNGFVQQSGGALKLESDPDEGTCVTLYFPPAK